MKLKRLLWGIARAGWLLSYGILLLLLLIHGAWLWATLAGACVAFSLLTSYGRWSWLVSLNLLGLLSIAGFVAVTLSSWGALLSVVLGLIAWDIELFVRRLEPFAEISRTVVRTHLTRLGLIAAVSVILGAVALTATLSLSFGWALLVAFSFLIVFLLLLRQALQG